MKHESVRFQLLKIADAVKDDPWDAPTVQLAVGYAAALSWLDPGLAELSFRSLVKARRERDMAQISACLDELTAGMEAA